MMFHVNLYVGTTRILHKAFLTREEANNYGYTACDLACQSGKYKRFERKQLSPIDNYGFRVLAV